MPKNVELLDNTNDILYPKTKTEQVIVTSTQNLNVKLADIDTKIKDVTDEVVNARNKTGNTHRTLKARLDAMEDGSTNIQNTLNQVQATANATKQEVEQARGGQANLNNRLNAMTNATTQAQQTATNANNTANNVKTEVEQARGGEANLKTRLDKIDTKFNNKVDRAGDTMTGKLNANAGIGTTVGNLELDATGEVNIAKNTNITGDLNTTQKIEAQGRVISHEAIYAYNGANGRFVAKVAGHGGVDLGDSNTISAICSNDTPKYFDGTNRYNIHNDKDHPISVPASANTLVKRKADGWIDNGTSGIIVNTIRSAGINILIGGNATDGTFTGDVVFQTSMRPARDGRKIRIGSTNYRFDECWVVTGAFNTSDERCKTNIETFDVEDCFNMVKNTDVKSYTLLTDDKTKMSDEELEVASLENEKKGVYQQLGIIAQDIVGYKCSDYILVQDNPEDLYAINPYNLTSAVMGALKVEIQKREELEERVKQLEEVVAKLTA